MKTLYCYGDSNTWGYDSRSWLGTQYPKEVRWTGILELESGCRVINDGMNGRTIPEGGFLVQQLAKHIAETAFTPNNEGTDVLILLGSNDLLNHPARGAAYTAARMDAFLGELLADLDALSAADANSPDERPGSETEHTDMSQAAQAAEAPGLKAPPLPASLRLWLISPPLMQPGLWADSEEILRQSRLLGEALRPVAERHHLRFLDAGKFDIPVLYDGVHFSEQGHRNFADMIRNYIL